MWFFALRSTNNTVGMAFKVKNAEFCILKLVRPGFIHFVSAFLRTHGSTGVLYLLYFWAGIMDFVYNAGFVPN